MKLWQQNPLIFFYDCFDWVLDPWQEDVTMDYLTDPRIGLIASKGPGKTCCMALCTWHFFLTKEIPKIACLSITKDNLKANLWAELRMLRSKSKLATLSTHDGTERIPLKGHEGYSFIDARSYAKNADEKEMASALAGFHANNIMFTIDEGGTIPDAVLNTADAALSSGSNDDTHCARIMVTANPEQPKGILYRASKGQTIQKWKIHHITGDPDDPKRAPMVDINWAKEQIEQYGRDHPWVMINVLAQYPNVAVDTLLSEEEVYESMRRDIDEREVYNSQFRGGLDVARGGADNSCLALRRGLKAYPIEEFPSTMLGPELASKLVFAHRDKKVERFYVDNTGGYGSSVMDSMMFHHSVDTIGVIYNARADKPKQYLNKRTEMWVRMRDWVKAGGCLPNDPDLARQLTEPKIYFRGGQMRLEEKEQIKERLGRSPDKADALAQTFKDVEEQSFYANPFNEHSSMPGNPHEQQFSGHLSDPSQQPFQSDISTRHQS